MEKQHYSGWEQEHDYTTAVMERRREYLPIEEVLKEKQVKFHTPMTKICVFLDSIIWNMDQAEDGLQAKGFLIPRRPDGRSTEMPRPHYAWQHQRIRDKLCGVRQVTSNNASDC